MDPSLGQSRQIQRETDKSSCDLFLVSHSSVNDGLGHQLCCKKPHFAVEEKSHWIKKKVQNSSEKVRGIYFMFFNLVYLSVWKHGSMQRLCALLAFSWGSRV